MGSEWEIFNLCWRSISLVAVIVAALIWLLKHHYVCETRPWKLSACEKNIRNDITDEFYKIINVRGRHIYSSPNKSKQGKPEASW